MRRPDWELRLVEYAGTVQGRAFSWGETDCFSLVCSALGAILEANPLADVPYYISRAEAEAVAETFADVAGELGRRGGTPYPIGFAQQGDIVTMPGDDGTGLPRFGFVVDGRGRVMTSEPHTGVEILPVEALPSGAAVWRWPA